MCIYIKHKKICYHFQQIDTIYLRRLIYNNIVFFKNNAIMKGCKNYEKCK